MIREIDNLHHFILHICKVRLLRFEGLRVVLKAIVCCGYQVHCLWLFSRTILSAAAQAEERRGTSNRDGRSRDYDLDIGIQVDLSPNISHMTKQLIVPRGLNETSCVQQTKRPAVLTLIDRCMCTAIGRPVEGGETCSLKLTLNWHIKTLNYASTTI
jgi:hypothetical protein